MKQKIHGAEWLYIPLVILLSLNNHCPDKTTSTSTFNFNFTGNYVKVSNSSWDLEAKVPGGVLGISSDGDDRMEPKVKTQKNP